MNCSGLFWSTLFQMSYLLDFIGKNGLNKSITLTALQTVYDNTKSINYQPRALQELVSLYIRALPGLSGLQCYDCLLQLEKRLVLFD